MNMNLIKNLMFKGSCRTPPSPYCKILPKSCILKEKKAEKLVKKNAGYPPVIYLTTSKYHISNYFYYDDILKYGSWENPEEKDIDIDRGLTIYKIKVETEISEEYKNSYNMALEEYFKKIHAITNASYRKYQRDLPELKDYEMKMETELYRVPKYVSICHKSLYAKFLNSCFGRFLYTILFLFGFSIIFDDIFFIIAKYEKIKVKRKISHDGSLKCQPYRANPQYFDKECDPKAINYYFSNDNSPEFYQLLDEELKKCDCTGYYAYFPPPSIEWENPEGKLINEPGYEPHGDFDQLQP